VKPCPRRQVELEIGVVHPVEPPERRHGMEQHVLQIDDKVEDDDGGDDGERIGHLPGVEEAEAL